jgi:hypothetical protein
MYLAMHDWLELVCREMGEPYARKRRLWISVNYNPWTSAQRRLAQLANKRPTHPDHACWGARHIDNADAHGTSIGQGRPHGVGKRDVLLCDETHGDPVTDGPVEEVGHLRGGHVCGTFLETSEEGYTRTSGG